MESRVIRKNVDDKMYSVLMSVYKNEKPAFLKESIESVLNQTLPTDDFVIVCDGPLTDELNQILCETKEEHKDCVTIHRLSKNVGLPMALNEGLKVCRNDIVARMDSDDICFLNRMETEYAFLQKEDLDLVGSALLEFSDDKEKTTAKREVPQDYNAICNFAKRRNPFNHPTVMYRKSSVEEVGGYQNFYLFEDYHLWVRMLMAGKKAMNVKQPLLYMRTGDGMFDRRGGIKYAGAIWRFRLYLFASGFCSWRDFLVTVLGHTFVALLPTKLRKSFYQRLLRKKA